jgi:hypothetical protein
MAKLRGMVAKQRDRCLRREGGVTMRRGMGVYGWLCGEGWVAKKRDGWLCGEGWVAKRRGTGG